MKFSLHPDRHADLNLRGIDDVARNDLVADRVIGVGRVPPAARNLRGRQLLRDRAALLVAAGLEFDDALRGLLETGSDGRFRRGRILAAEDPVAAAKAIRAEMA